MDYSAGQAAPTLRPPGVLDDEGFEERAVQAFQARERFERNHEAGSFGGVLEDGLTIKDGQIRY
jgi:hypothetical protein